MKNIKTYEMFISDKSESVNESLKSVVVGTMLSLSTLLSNDIKASVKTDSGPLYHRSTSLRSKLSGDYYYNVNKYPQYRDTLIKELSKIDIKDESLIKIFTHLRNDDINDLDIKSINRDLKQYCNLKSYDKLSKILNRIDNNELSNILSNINGIGNHNTEPELIILKFIKTLNMTIGSTDPKDNIKNSFTEEELIVLSLIALMLTIMTILMIKVDTINRRGGSGNFRTFTDEDKESLSDWERKRDELDKRNSDYRNSDEGKKSLSDWERKRDELDKRNSDYRNNR